MASPRPRPNGRQLARWGTRVHLVVRTTQRELAYRWSIPRSPVLRVLVTPLFIGGMLLLVLVGALVIAIALVGAVLALIALILAGLLWSLLGHLKPARRRRRWRDRS